MQRAARWIVTVMACRITSTNVRVRRRVFPVDKTGCPHAGIEVIGDEWVVRGSVLFDTNKHAIKTEAKDVLSKIAAFLVKNTQYNVEIQGHTDSTGTAAWNDTLSQRRADSVKTFLAAEGVGADRMTAKGYGPSDPIAPKRHCRRTITEPSRRFQTFRTLREFSDSNLTRRSRRVFFFGGLLMLDT